jgi:hypothetical protein
MKVMLSALTIIVGAIGAPKISALPYSKDQPWESFKNGFRGGGLVRKMLRDNKDLAGESRIVGGDDADIGEYPFFVEWQGCGASLIHKGTRSRNPSYVTSLPMLTLRIFPWRHIQISFYPRLIVLRSRQTRFTSDLPVKVPLMTLEAVVSGDPLSNALLIHPIVPAQLITTISS